MPHNCHIAFIERSVVVRNDVPTPFGRVLSRSARPRAATSLGRYSRSCNTPMPLPFSACHGRHTWVEKRREILAVFFALLKSLSSSINLPYDLQIRNIQLRTGISGCSRRLIHWQKMGHSQPSPLGSLGQTLSQVSGAFDLCRPKST